MRWRGPVALSGSLRHRAVGCPLLRIVRRWRPGTGSQESGLCVRILSTNPNRDFNSLERLYGAATVPGPHRRGAGTAISPHVTTFTGCPAIFTVAVLGIRWSATWWIRTLRPATTGCSPLGQP